VIHNAITKRLTGFGGYLKCTDCGATRPLGDIATKLANGWPKQCGYTMRWITAKQAKRGKEE
jgi:hypothetical protein